MNKNILLGIVALVVISAGAWLWRQEEIVPPPQDASQTVERQEGVTPSPVSNKTTPAPTPTSLKVISPADNPSGTVLYSIGSQMTIKWEDGISANYELRLNGVIDCPPGAICVQGFSTYLINPSVVGNSYTWTIGKVWDDPATRGNNPPPPGEYRIEVCRQGTQVCANSDVISLAITSNY